MCPRMPPGSRPYPFAPHLGVIFDYNTGVQRLLQGHVNPITATAVSKENSDTRV